MKEAYISNRDKIMRFIKDHCNDFQISKFVEYFEYMSTYYFENEQKLVKMCKYKTFIRTTNLIESQHSSFKKSIYFGRNQSKQVVVAGNCFTMKILLV